MASLQQRRAAFGKFVRAALKDAQDRRMTIADIERATGVGDTTFYRWRDGDWTKDPRPTQVDAFCEGLQIPKSAAYRALGWGMDGERPAEPEPLIEPDLRRIQRRLLDPNTSVEEKAAIRSALRFIAGPNGGRRGKEAAG